MSAFSSEKRHKLEELRRAFDESFIKPASTTSESFEKMLAIVVGKDRFVIRISEISGIESWHKVVPLPRGPRGLLGLAGVRSRLFATYDLLSLIGGHASTQQPRWLILCRGADESIALAIAELEEFLDVSATQLHPVDAGMTNGYVREFVEHGETRRAVLHIPSLCTMILHLAGDKAASAVKES
jgi:chemotaxis signal transduction protein